MPPFLSPFGGGGGVGGATPSLPSSVPRKVGRMRRHPSPTSIHTTQHPSFPWDTGSGKRTVQHPSAPPNVCLAPQALRTFRCWIGAECCTNKDRFHRGPVPPRPKPCIGTFPASTLAPASIRTRVWGTRTHPSHHRMDPDVQSRNTGHAFPGTDPPAFLLRRPRNPDGMSDPKGKHRGRKDGSKPNEPNNRTRGPGDGRRNANRGGATTTP